ncbi:PASTA domain-containing protein [Agromyces sp. MMS24-JH15]|uniref:serine/threonine-protein kinase n=1 Tax=Agromyces sp. MMS24-JH15 TaxID=3243765 RepID=UPI003748CAA9
MTGALSDRFRIGELLGSGGTASVFTAVDLERGGPVALKVLHPHLSAEEPVRSAFLREAAPIRELAHPNIVRVLDAGVATSAGRPAAWIAFELVDGVTLADRVAAGGPLSVVDAIATAIGLLAALGAAHEVGVVHRDVAPGNVMVPASGPIAVESVRLVDFGLADAIGRASVGTDLLRSELDGDGGGGRDGDDGDGGGGGARGAGGVDVGADALGVIASVRYASPEQLRGEPVDERGDVYQAGAVLHFALTGRPPFDRPTTAEVVRAHLESPPPVPSVLDSRIPRALDRIVVRALLKDPADRFDSARDLADAIALVALPQPGDGLDALTTRRFEASTIVLAPTATTSVLPPAQPSSAQSSVSSSPVVNRPTGSKRPNRPVAPAAVAAAAAATAITAGARIAPGTEAGPGEPAAGRGEPPAGPTRVATAPAPESSVADRTRPPTTTASGPPPADAIRPAAAIGWGATLVGIALVAGILAFTAAVAPGAPAQPTTSPDAVAPPESAAPPSDLIPDEPDGPAAPPGVAVPDLAGLALAEAGARLGAAGLAVGDVVRVASTRAEGTVLEARPGASTPVSRGAAVALVVASGANTVPDVAGLAPAGAAAALVDSGFVVAYDGGTGPVTGTRPAAGVTFALGSTVTVLRSTAQPTPTPTPTATPTPSAPPTPDPAAAGGTPASSAASASASAPAARTRTTGG